MATCTTLPLSTHAVRITRCSLFHMWGHALDLGVFWCDKCQLVDLGASDAQAGRCHRDS